MKQNVNAVHIQNCGGSNCPRRKIRSIIKDVILKINKLIITWNHWQNFDSRVWKGQQIPKDCYGGDELDRTAGGLEDLSGVQSDRG